MTMIEDWPDDLGRWLDPFLAHLRHPRQRAMCRLYVAGLIKPGERKNVHSLAQRLGQPSHDGLHHFVSAGSWNTAPLEAELLAQVDRLIGGDETCLVVDEVALPKKGTHSVGVAPQFVPGIGRTINCQTLMALTLVSGEVAVPISLRLRLPEGWLSDPSRLDKAGVPPDHRVARTKPEMALAEIDRAIALGARFGSVVVGTHHGGADYRRGLAARGLPWTVGVRGDQRVISPGGQSSEKALATTKQHELDPALTVEMLLTEHSAQNPPWMRDAMERRRTLSPARQAHLDEPASPGPPIASRDDIGAMWFIKERNGLGGSRYYAADLLNKMPRRHIAAAVKAHGVCEEALSRLRMLGLQHYEGRSWTGLHRHALMVLKAFAFLEHHRATFVHEHTPDVRERLEA